MAEATYLVADVAGDVASYATGVEVDPARTAAAQDRLAVLTALVRRHGEDVEAVLAWAEQASARLLELDGTDDRRAELERLTAEAQERAREAELLRLGLAEVEAAAPLAGEDEELRAEIRRLDAADELRAAAAERTREAELLRLGLAEVEAAAPQPGEGAALAVEIERLANAYDLRAAAATAQQALTCDESSVDDVDALQLVTAARRALEGGSDHDPALKDLAGRVAEAAHLLADAAGDLASYAASVDADPARLSAAQDRLAVLTALVRRHAADDVDGVLAWAASAVARLGELEGDDDRIEQLAAEDARLEAELGEVGEALSEARTEAAARFGAAVGAELADLAMPHAEVTAAVTSREQDDGLPVGGRRLAAGPEGVDDVELLLAPHPGAPPRPLHRGASGGELSRVMLAVEVVFAGSDPVPLMVFDEVDAGVGGRAAVEVGRRLARLARDHQVVVVTHLPQVAAFADRHLLVVKGGEGPEAGTVTRSGVIGLDDAGRVAELSRMLAGHDSGLARGHAEELLQAAEQDKAAAGA